MYLPTDLHDLLLGLFWKFGSLDGLGLRIIDHLRHWMLQRIVRVHWHNCVHLEALHLRNLFGLKVTLILSRVWNSTGRTDAGQCGWMALQIVCNNIQQLSFVRDSAVSSHSIIFKKHSHSSWVTKVLWMGLVQLKKHRKVELATSIGDSLSQRVFHGIFGADSSTFTMASILIEVAWVEHLELAKLLSLLARKFLWIHDVVSLFEWNSCRRWGNHWRVRIVVILRSGDDRFIDGSNRSSQG